MVYLMYHELQLPERELCDQEQGYARYVVAEGVFREQLSHLKSSGFRGLNVTEALADTVEKTRSVCLTFDDGCETDLQIAAPLLQANDFNATFYVTVAHLERRGYLSRRQLRELSDQGFEIGCHSMNHVYLTDLPQERLRTEIVESKDRLEQLTGKPVAHFSCPGGRWDRRVATLAQEAGYASVATSRIGVNLRGADRYCLSRIAIKRDVSITEFARLCRSKGLKLRQAQSAMLASAKRVLGNSMYEKIRARVLGQGSEASG
jgi:hypothetical protein